jgi:hypothetical protein
MRRLLSVWQEWDLLAMENRLGPPRSRTDRVLLAECDHAPWEQSIEVEGASLLRNYHEYPQYDTCLKSCKIPGFE